MEQKIIKSLVWFVCSFLVVTAANMDRSSLLRTDKMLMDFMMSSRASQETNPVRSVSCFQYYMPLLNQLTADYEAQYEKCLGTSHNAVNKVNVETLPERRQLESLGKNSCDTVLQCSSLRDAVESLQCFQYQSSANTKEFYAISNTASESLLEIREKIRLIQLDEYRCTNASDRKVG